MKKILLVLIAMFLGSNIVAVAQNYKVDNGYANACRFKDDNGTVWNGSTSTTSRSYNSSSSNSTSGSATGTIETKAWGQKASGSATVSGSSSYSSGSVQTRTQSECCVGNSNNCSSTYKNGHSRYAKNADNSTW